MKKQNFSGKNAQSVSTIRMQAGRRKHSPGTKANLSNVLSFKE